MKTAFFTFALIFSVLTSAFSQACPIPNGSFESWEDLTFEYEYYGDLPDETIMLPEGYFAFFRLFLSALSDLFEVLTGDELIDAAASLFAVYQSTDATDGEFAAQIGGDEYFPFSDLMTVFECTSELPSSFSIDVKHVGGGLDTLTIIGSFKEDSDIIAEEAELDAAAGYFIIDSLLYDEDTEYVTLNVPIIDNMNGVSPDSVFIVIIAAGNQDSLEAGVESYFLLDNMQFSLEGVLPLATTMFAGEHYHDFNQVHWSVAYEDNVSHYNIERSIDNTDSWSEIMSVNPNPQGILNYNFRDFDIEKAGEYFYRLRRVDESGKESLSDVISIEVPMLNRMSVSTYPNPVKETFNIELSLKQNTTNLSLVLYSSAGKSYVLHSGVSLEAGNHELTFDTNSIPKGIYNLVIESPFAQANKRIVFTR